MIRTSTFEEGYDFGLATHQNWKPLSSFNEKFILIIALFLPIILHFIVLVYTVDFLLAEATLLFVLALVMFSYSSFVKQLRFDVLVIPGVRNFNKQLRLGIFLSLAIIILSCGSFFISKGQSSKRTLFVPNFLLSQNLLGQLSLWIYLIFLGFLAILGGPLIVRYYFSFIKEKLGCRGIFYLFSPLILISFHAYWLVNLFFSNPLNFGIALFFLTILYIIVSVGASRSGLLCAMMILGAVRFACVVFLFASMIKGNHQNFHQKNIWKVLVSVILGS